jgi:transcriptional regulator with XRE-family HTH domain
MPRQKSTHVDDPLLVGERLRAARERAGLSQRRLSFPGCSPAYISRVESGDRIPSLQLLRELGRRLGVSEDWLATGSEERDGLGGALLEGEVALRLGQLDLAESLYSRLLERGTAQASAHEGLGRVELARSNARGAIERFEAALELYGDAASAHPDLAEGLGRALAQVGEIAAATAVFESSAAEAERTGDGLEQARFELLLGESLTEAGDLDRAADVLGRALDEEEGWAGLDKPVERYWAQSQELTERKQHRPAAGYARRALELLRAAEDGSRAERAYQLLTAVKTGRSQLAARPPGTVDHRQPDNAPAVER